MTKNRLKISLILALIMLLYASPFAWADYRYEMVKLKNCAYKMLSIGNDQPKTNQELILMLAYNTDEAMEKQARLDLSKRPTAVFDVVGVEPFYGDGKTFPKRLLLIFFILNHEKLTFTLEKQDLSDYQSYQQQIKKADLYFLDKLDELTFWQLEGSEREIPSNMALSFVKWNNLTTGRYNFTIGTNEFGITFADALEIKD